MSSYPTVFHIGTLKCPDRKRVSYEGAGLSVSEYPEEWRRIARLSGQFWMLDTREATFFDATPETEAAAVDWAVEQGYLDRTEVFEVAYWDDELERFVTLTFHDYDKATTEAAMMEEEVQACEGVRFGVRGLDYWKRTFSADPCEDLAKSFAILWWAEANGYDGVWWDEELDITRLSAPRGVLFAPGKWPSKKVGE